MIKSRYMAIAGTALVLATAFGACKGRTADNMEPLGETVEVEIPMPPEAPDGRGVPQPAQQEATDSLGDIPQETLAPVDTLVD